ncbi:hypothetical protein [Pseudooceanicola aestuarii]|uniref:hypothetical protein n=1 Tax=Pseudooceanicola aestuarii TaxID=2697319 RepID=UPI0013D0EB15|nr:hypothetical protein [Pseudooceanicola aestuarii]
MENLEEADAVYTERMVELACRAHSQRQEAKLMINQAALDSAALVVKSLILVNGGAVIALLAFAGAIESANGADIDIAHLVNPMSRFAWGVGLAIVTSAFA